MFAEQARLDLRAHQEHRRGRAVVGAAAGVLLDAPAELAEGHHQHAIVILLLFQIGPERAHALRQLRHQLIVPRLLVRRACRTRRG